jgi:FKBP-type peptidyl-prolyl cis-trans isomerase
MMGMTSRFDGAKMSRILMTMIGTLLLSLQVWADSANEDEADNLRGLDFWNKIDREVIETASGLKYKALITGSGRIPKSTDKVVVHYRGLLLNGVVFDSSFSDDEPVTFKLRGLIDGWKEGLRLMPVGSVFVFLIPPELAYGDSGGRSVPPNSTLIFEVELFEIK